LLILTSSQLSTLARGKYLNDIKTSLPVQQPPTSADEDDDEEDLPVRQSPEPKCGWLNFFSVESMGLSEYAETTSSSPLQFISRLIPGFSESGSRPAEAELFDQDEEEDKAEAERLYLTYSWWLLHEGWQEVADRVDAAVEQVFAR
jgi:peroxin-3